MDKTEYGEYDTIFFPLQCSCDIVAGDAGHDVPPGPVQSLADPPPLPPLALRLAGRHGDRALPDHLPADPALHHLAQHPHSRHLLLLHHLRLLPLHRQDVLHSQTLQLYSLQVIFISAVESTVSSQLSLKYIINLSFIVILTATCHLEVGVDFSENLY